MTLVVQKYDHLLLRATLSLFDMTAGKAEGSKRRKTQVKGSLQAKVALSEKKKESTLGLNGAIDPAPMEDTPSRGLAHSEETGVRSISVPLLWP